MVLSQKSQYAVRAVLELAKQYGNGPVNATRIAQLQVVPVRFLENILAQLRQAGIVESTRGKEGGYHLAVPPRRLRVGDVVRLIEGPINAIECAGSVENGRRGPARECPLRPGCVLLPMWEKAHKAMMDVFDGTTFADLVEQEQATCLGDVVDYAI